MPYAPHTTSAIPGGGTREHDPAARGCRRNGRRHEWCRTRGDRTRGDRSRQRGRPGASAGVEAGHRCPALPGDRTDAGVAGKRRARQRPLDAAREEAIDGLELPRGGRDGTHRRRHRRSAATALVHHRVRRIDSAFGELQAYDRRLASRVARAMPRCRPASRGGRDLHVGSVGLRLPVRNRLARGA